MAATLVEYKYLGHAAEIRRGIAETIVYESPWLADLPFVEIPNDTSRYKMETQEARADTYEVGDTWLEGTPQWEYRDAPLAIIGGDADDDNFGRLAAAGEDTMAAMVSLKSKAVANRFNKLAILGQTTSNAGNSASKNFKGLVRLNCECESSTATDLDGLIYSSWTGQNGTTGNNSQVIVGAASASATIAFAMLDVLRYMVKPKSTHFVSHWSMFNKLQSLALSSGQNLEHDKNQLGMPVTRYGEQILLQDDWCPVNFNDPASSVCSPASWDDTQAVAGTKDTIPIWAVRFGEDGLCGINGEGMIQIEKFDKLETKDAKRVRIKFYCGMRLTNKLALAGLYGCTTS